MKSEKLIIQLEKITEKLEAINYDFPSEESQEDFSQNKQDAISLLNDMIEILSSESSEEECD